MAIVTGNSGVVKMHTTDGDEAAVGQVRDFSIESTTDTIESSVMGDDDRKFLKSLNSHTVNLNCYWDEADTIQILLDPSKTIYFEIYPTGTGSGEEFYAGEGILTSKSISAAFDGMVEASFTVQVNGAVAVADAP